MRRSSPGSGDAGCVGEAVRTRTGTAGRRAQGGADSGWRGLKGVSRMMCLVRGLEPGCKTP